MIDSLIIGLRNSLVPLSFEEKKIASKLLKF